MAGRTNSRFGALPNPAWLSFLEERPTPTELVGKCAGLTWKGPRNHAAEYGLSIGAAMAVQMAREWLTVHAGSGEVAEGLASFHEKRHVDYERLRQEMVDERLRHRAYTRAEGDDMPDVRDWTWPG